MSTLNKVMLIGSLGKDPDIKQTKAGKPIAMLSLATSESWKDKTTGERKEKTEWHNVVVYNEGLCGVIERYVSKGSKVYVEGRLVTRKWQDKNGSDRYTTEVVLQAFQGQLILLGEKGGGNGDNQRNFQSPSGGLQSPKGNSGGFQHQLDDDIPF